MVKANILNLSNPDHQLITTTSSALQTLKEELNQLFPQRSGVIEQALLALSMREHLLVWGDTGTAKSLFARAIFNAFTGAAVFEANLSKFSTKQDIFGPLNTKLMTEEGRIRFWLDEGAVFCNFVFLDEFLDASDPLLRATLTLLNERYFLNGKVKTRSAVHTTIATTNGDPWGRTKSNPDLRAVIDRFLFISRVSYLDTDTEVLQMLGTYLNGLTPATQISLQDLTEFSEIVVDNNLVTNPILIQAYVKAMNEFKKNTGKTISDRSLARLTQVLEAQALLFGRSEIVPEDIFAVKYGVCDGEDEEGLKAFVAAATPAVKEAEKELGANIDEAQQNLLNEYAQQIPSLRTDTVSVMTAEDLVRTAQELTALLAKVKAVRQQTQATGVIKDTLIEKINKKLTLVQKSIFKS